MYQINWEEVDFERLMEWLQTKWVASMEPDMPPWNRTIQAYPSTMDSRVYMLNDGSYVAYQSTYCGELCEPKFFIGKVAKV